MAGRNHSFNSWDNKASDEVLAVLGHGNGKWHTSEAMLPEHTMLPENRGAPTEVNCFQSKAHMA